MISQNFIKKLFTLASIQRWNDHLRPIKLTELDKQAHKMMIAYVLAKSTTQNNFNWQHLIEAEIFEFIRNMVLTDIKRPVFTFLIKHKRDEINTFIFNSVKNDLGNVCDGFWDRLVSYFTDEKYFAAEREILDLASKIASLWEYNLIYDLNRHIHNVEEVRSELEAKIAGHPLMITSNFSQFKNFINLYGQLRFQVRWARTPRTPETSVLGHLLIAAVITYFFILESGVKFSAKRIYNNFFATLFHDLPEALTRDIISPVKSGIEGLDELVKEYEKEAINLELLPSLPVSWHQEILYFIDDEFDNKIIDDKGNRQKINQDAQVLLTEEYNFCKFNPLDGRLVKIADELSAYLEALISIEHGIRSPDLEDGRDKIREKYLNKKVANLDLKLFFA